MAGVLRDLRFSRAQWSINWEHRQYLSTCVGGYVAGRHEYPCEDGDTIGDMCILDYGGSTNGCVPPNLINTLISIALSPGSCDEPMFPGQAGLQTVILLVAFGSVPVLLFGKPCMLAQSSHDHGHADVEMVAVGDDDEHEEEHSFGEMMIHQAIETIEFVLGMVSNTASCACVRRPHGVCLPVITPFVRDL